ncbi:hypothetical protein JMA_35370 [Jeotgalibacillus malaysiensis]|uniref:Reverse transcriptase domain-containing protein n=1 Tax=Jeotgalibacillus malaysiensis TaxID=1508404 RepID=A0A0B5AXZ2_9BACL|nr:reverse transcriptase domain-containing protein [Jeotgalibacillus malaysiensis]AJD92854.1 hypothetical protein JMA_35370 [Jeotgalibacillus malaysiensis]
MSAAKEFNLLYTKKGLKNIFEKYIHRSSAIGIDNVNYRQFVENIDNELEIIERKTKQNTYKFTRYKEKLILKGRDRFPRVISIPTLRDKVTLKGLQLIIQKGFPNENQRLSQRCVELISKNANEYNTFIKFDITNFYGNLNHKILFDKLNKRIRKKEIINLIEKSITTETSNKKNEPTETITKGVPQGLSISNILAHIYLLDIDHKYQEKNSLFYIRYVDDIIILCDAQEKEKIYKEVLYDIEGLHALPINKNKTYDGLLTEGFDFLGYNFKKDDELRVDVKKFNKNKYAQSIVDLFINFQRNNKISPEQFLYYLNIKITGSISKKVSGNRESEHTYGWLFYFSQINDTTFLYHLDWLVNKLLKKTKKCEHIDPTRIKSFVTAYYEIKYNYKESSYINRPDDLTISEQKELLIETFKIKKDTLNTDDKVQRIYKKLVYDFINQQEKEVQAEKS